MKIKFVPIGVSVAVLLFISCPYAFANPTISNTSERAIRIRSARLIKAPGDGSYVTGMVEPAFGYSAPRAVHVHIAVYDSNGKLLAEKVDKISSNFLERSHLHPRPRASYTAFFPWPPSQIAKITVMEHSGHTHASP